MELRILGELKSHRLGGVATLSSLPVPLAVAGSSDKTSSLHHAAHSPFGLTHSGLSDQRHKHGPARRRRGSPNSCARGYVQSPLPPPSLLRQRYERNDISQELLTRRVAWSADEGLGFHVRHTHVRVLSPFLSSGVIPGNSLLPSEL